MTNRVRISYSVPLTEIPSELQRITNQTKDDLMRLVESINELNFTEDFTISSHKTKLCWEYAASIESRLADANQIAAGYTEIQESIAQPSADDSAFNQELLNEMETAE